MAELVARAREVVARQALAARLVARGEQVSKLEAAERAIAAAESAVSMFDRAAFFHESESEERVAQLRQVRDHLAGQLVAIDEEAHAAMSQAVRELPPLGVATEVAQIIRRARLYLFRHVAKGGASAERRAIVDSLELLGQSLIDIWTPGLDVEAIRAVLADEATRARLARPLEPLEEDARLGYAPLLPQELAVRLASQLETHEYRSARAVMAKEGAELDVALRELAEAKKRRRFLSSADARAEGRAHEVAHHERAQAFQASELVAQVFHGALASFPPLRIWLAVETLVALHSGAAPPMEQAVHLDGVVRLIPSFCYRAIVVDALAALRRATDAAFPGLLSLVEGDDESAVRAQRDAKRGWSPFRVAAIALAGDDATADNVSTLMRLYDEAGVPGMLRRARLHALLSGTAGRARHSAKLRIGTLDRIAIWSDSKAEADEAVATQRTDWHRAALVGAVGQIARTIWPLGQRFHALRARDAIVRLQLGLGMVRTHGETFQRDMVCPVFGREYVYPALEALAHEIGTHWNNHALYHALAEPKRALDSIHAVRTRHSSKHGSHYRCHLLGFGEACFAAQAWARHAFATIGEMPPDGLLLCHYVEQLGARPESG